MYSLDPQRLPELRAGRASGIGANVYFLGLTSLLTDISSEMVTLVLPLYLVVALHLSPLQIGFVDGLHQGAAALARLASGWIADRWRRNREVAAAGYALSAACKLGLLAAGNAWYLLSSVIALDRIGKGIRTSPRDALISLSAEPARLGFAFGVHRAFDTAGALLGPLVAFAILASLPDAYDVVFVVSFCIAVIGVAALLAFVRNPPPRTDAGTRRKPALADAAGLLRQRRFRAVVVAAAVLGLVTVADSFFYLLIQRIVALPASAFPLLYLGTALSYLLLAIPAGRLADRIGRGRVILLGYVLLLLACCALLASPSGIAWAAVSLALLGAYYACTDGVLMAVVGTWLPEALRATGMAIVTTATGLARLAASILFGSLWQGWGLEAAVAAFAVALGVVLLATSRIWLRLE